MVLSISIVATSFAAILGAGAVINSLIRNDVWLVFIVGGLIAVLFGK